MLLRGRRGRQELGEEGLPCGRRRAAVRAGEKAACEGNEEGVEGLMYIITGSVQCNGGNDASLTADAGGTPSGQSSAALLRGEQIWFQLCLAPRALVTLDHTELRYRMVYRPLNEAE